MKSSKNIVFIVSALITLAIAIWGIVGSESFGAAANALMQTVTDTVGWLYLGAMLSFVIFALIIAMSRFGDIKLGPDDAKPEYKTISWFGMLFGAGMGIGLVFYGVAEPITHYLTPIAGVEPASVASSNFAIKASFMHWGLHPWAGYSVIGLGLAYFQFRKNKPGLISSLFIPLIGEERASGPIGKIIDIFAVIATVAGVATSLGMGTLQINSGLSYLFNLPNSAVTWLIIIVFITVIFIGTAVSGIEKGINAISNLNLILAAALVLIAIFVGPKIMMANTFVSGLGAYINDFFRDSLVLNPFGDNSWVNGWRIFYWAWWIAWAPFVGTFIARISRGRTVREFIFGVIIAPALASIIWFSVFGCLGLNLALDFGIPALKELVTTPETALYVVFAQYPLGLILSLITLVLLCTFFITSANSATFVLSMFSEQGSLNPSRKKMFIWGILQSAIAYGLMLSGGLKALQTASVAAAFPFIFIMFLVMASIVIAFRGDRNKEKVKEKLNEETPYLEQSS